MPSSGEIRTAYMIMQQSTCRGHSHITLFHWLLPNMGEMLVAAGMIGFSNIM